jgi:hypothetical protein
MTEDRRRVLIKNRLALGTVLVDGFVGGTWRTKRDRGKTTLLIEPFQPLPVGDRDALTEEAERLVRFLGEGAEVRFARRT